MGCSRSWCNTGARVQRNDAAEPCVFRLKASGRVVARSRVWATSVGYVSRSHVRAWRFRFPVFVAFLGYGCEAYDFNIIMTIFTVFPRLQTRPEGLDPLHLYRSLA